MSLLDSNPLPIYAFYYSKVAMNVAIWFYLLPSSIPLQQLIISDSNGIWTHNLLFRTRAIPVWLYGWVFVYKLSGCWFESCCSHVTFKYPACLDQVPWHSDNYRVQIHFKTSMWNNKNTQLIIIFTHITWFLGVTFWWNRPPLTWVVLRN